MNGVTHVDDADLLLQRLGHPSSQQQNFRVTSATRLPVTPPRDEVSSPAVSRTRCLT